MSLDAESRLDHWEDLVTSLDPGPYSLSYYDYDNALDNREILADLLDSGDLTEVQKLRLETLDQRFIAATTTDLLKPISEPYRRREAWWKLRRPTRPGDELLEDLMDKGFLAPDYIGL